MKQIDSIHSKGVHVKAGFYVLLKNVYCHDQVIEITYKHI